MERLVISQILIPRFLLSIDSYGLELEGLKSVLTVDSFKEPTQREEAKKAIKKLFEERYDSVLCFFANASVFMELELT